MRVLSQKVGLLSRCCCCYRALRARKGSSSSLSERHESAAPKRPSLLLVPKGTIDFGEEGGQQQKEGRGDSRELSFGVPSKPTLFCARVSEAEGLLLPRLLLGSCSRVSLLSRSADQEGRRGGGGRGGGGGGGAGEDLARRGRRRRRGGRWWRRWGATWPRPWRARSAAPRLAARRTRSSSSRSPSSWSG